VKPFNSSVIIVDEYLRKMNIIVKELQGD